MEPLLSNPADDPLKCSLTERAHLDEGLTEREGLRNDYALTGSESVFFFLLLIIIA